MGKLKFQKMRPKTKEGFKKTGSFLIKYGGAGPVGLAKMAAGGAYELSKRRKEKKAKKQQQQQQQIVSTQVK